jgi:hypothetical protein
LDIIPSSLQPNQLLPQRINLVCLVDLLAVFIRAHILALVLPAAHHARATWFCAIALRICQVSLDSLEVSGGLGTDFDLAFAAFDA